ncbi:MAG: hypothetical protein ABSA57_13685 [Candidatus Acidiferrales bacterium]
MAWITWELAGAAVLQAQEFDQAVAVATAAVPAIGCSGSGSSGEPVDGNGTPGNTVPAGHRAYWKQVGLSKECQMP